MRVLWITRLAPYPPSHGGDAMYSAGLIESLAHANAEVTVITHDNGAAPKAVAGVEWDLVRGRPRRALDSLATRSPSLVHRFSTRQLVDRVRERSTTESWDAVIVDNIAVAGALMAWKRTHRRPTIAYIAHNHEASVRRAMARMMPLRSPRRWALEIDALKVRRLEEEIVRDADVVTAITPEDARRFRDLQSVARVIELTPGYSGDVVIKRAINSAVPPRIVVLGSFVWLAKRHNLELFLNAAAGLEVLGIRVAVVGAITNDTADLLRSRHPSVTFTGAVIDIAPYLKQARMGVIAEGVGGGFKLKALDYVFHRVPMAALRGSIGGMPLVPGESVLEYAALDSMARGIADTIGDFDRLNQVQKAAFEACRGKFDWTARGAALLEALVQSSNGIRFRGTIS